MSNNEIVILGGHIDKGPTHFDGFIFNVSECALSENLFNPANNKYSKFFTKDNYFVKTGSGEITAMIGSKGNNTELIRFTRENLGIRVIKKL